MLQRQWLNSGAAMEINLILPYPVSNNTYYRNFKGITVISKRGREYKAEVANLCKFAGITEISGKVAVSLEICPKKPKKDTGKEPRCLDLDNIFKACLDSLQGHAYANDAQIWILSGRRGEPVPGGQLNVRVTAI